jgi:competence protein ComEC
LAGAQPAVLRAVIMGFAGLIGLALERKIHPLGSLLVAATGLLLWNPLWISDLGFELSMLATLGLLVTAKPLSDWLDRLPSPIASAIAVPLAAYLWTIPLQLNAFGVVSPYSIPANLITTPLISLLSLGGMVSALAALVHPLLGSWTALGLHYPTIALLKVVEFFCQLPGNSIALGTLPLGWMLLLYGLLVLVTWHSGVRRYGWGVAIGAITLVLVWQLHQSTLQVTALVTAPQPVVAIPKRWR